MTRFAEQILFLIKLFIKVCYESAAPATMLQRHHLMFLIRSSLLSNLAWHSLQTICFLPFGSLTKVPIGFLRKVSASVLLQMEHFMASRFVFRYIKLTKNPYYQNQQEAKLLEPLETKGFQKLYITLLFSFFYAKNSCG